MPLSNNQERYKGYLIEKLKKEFESVENYVEGRISTCPRMKMSKEMQVLAATALVTGSYSVTKIGLPMLPFPPAAPIGITAIIVGVLGSVTFSYARYELNNQQKEAWRYANVAIHNYPNSTVLPEQRGQEIEKLLAEVASQSTDQYEYAINFLLQNEDIERFAEFGAIRIIEYLIRKKITQLNKDELITGLSRGNSGSGVYDLTNNFVICKDGNKRSIEEIYARSAILTETGLYIINPSDRKILQRIKEQGQGESHYRKTELEENIPICVRLGTDEETKELNASRSDLDKKSPLLMHFRNPDFSGREIIRLLKLPDNQDELTLFKQFKLLPVDLKKQLVSDELKKINTSTDHIWKRKLLYLISYTPLETLNLSHFSELVDNTTIKLIFRESCGQSLRLLNLEGCHRITAISNVQRSSATYFLSAATVGLENLQELNVSNCTELNSLQINAPNLNTVTVTNATLTYIINGRRMRISNIERTNQPINIERPMLPAMTPLSYRH